MARQRIEKLVDDLNGDLADETVTFSVNGDEYEIDLSKENAKIFWSTWAPWMRAAQKVVRHRRRPKPRGPGVITDTTKVRGWARSKGLKVNRFGYPSTEVQRQYLQAWIDNDVPPEYA